MLVMLVKTQSNKPACKRSEQEKKSGLRNIDTIPSCQG